MRIISEPMMAEITAEESADIALVFIEIVINPTETLRAYSHGEAGWDQPAFGGEAITRNGDEYYPFAFSIGLPDELEDNSQPILRLSIDDVDSQIIAKLLALTEPVPFTLAMALKSSPDVTEAGTWDLEMRTARWGDDGKINAELIFNSIMSQEFPSVKFTPSNTAALF